MQHQLNWQNLQHRKLLDYYYYTQSYCTSGTTLLLTIIISHFSTRANHQLFSFIHPSVRTNLYSVLAIYLPVANEE